VLQLMAGEASPLPPKEATLVTDFQKIALEDEFDVPARKIAGKTAGNPPA
jgi:hypothetical protein